MKHCVAVGCALGLSAVVGSPLSHHARLDCRDVPAPPEPEPIFLFKPTLPPTSPSDDEGSCTPDLNPHATGCIAKHGDLHSGHFLPDNEHFVAITNYTGAPAAPDPASIYQGQHVILVKSDDSTFSSGDSWKCVTCGLPAENYEGRNPQLDYPQAFRNDPKRLLSGTNIIECSGEEIASDSCTPEKTFIRPIRWNTSVNGTGPGGAMRELRIHPDGVHLGFSSFTFSGGSLGQFAYYGRLVWNENPDKGEPMVPRYDVENVQILFSDNPNDNDRVIVDPADPQKLLVQPEAITVGELRGFTGTGKEITYVGAPLESSNIDGFATDLTTGVTRRLTAHPEYVDPIDVSPDDEWTVVMDTRGTDRQMFLAGLRGIPPLTDLITSSVTSATRNNGNRRFFNPFLIDKYGDRGDYFGQQITGNGDGVPGDGAFNDPVWNGRADPRWSWDGTKIVYTQIMPYAPACGDPNPLPCYPSTEPGGSIERIVVATLTDRDPLPPMEIEEASDVVPWGAPFPPGSTVPERTSPPPGQYVLEGKYSGHANVTIQSEDDSSFVGVVYNNFSDDGKNFLNGSEDVTQEPRGSSVVWVDWFSDLEVTGPHNGTKMTGPDGFQLNIDVLVNLFDANGTMTTTVNGREYYQPANGQ